MSETAETIEIAKALKAGLDAVLTDIPVYAAGVPTDEDGNIDESAAENKRKNPHVVIVMRERNPIGYRSVMQHFPGRVAVVTHFADDPFQAQLMTLARAVGAYLGNAPTLALELRKFDALTVDAAPETGFDGQLQYMEWTVMVHTGPAQETEGE